MVDYVKLDEHARRHRARYTQYVTANGFACQECGGLGDYVEEVIDGWPREEECGWCEGTGKTTRWGRGLWLREKRRAALAEKGDGG